MKIKANTTKNNIKENAKTKSQKLQCVAKKASHSIVFCHVKDQKWLIVFRSVAGRLLGKEACAWNPSFGLFLFNILDSNYNCFLFLHLGFCQLDELFAFAILI